MWRLVRYDEVGWPLCDQLRRHEWRRVGDGAAGWQRPLPDNWRAVGVCGGGTRVDSSNAITKAANTEEIKDKEAHTKSEQTALLNYKEDFATTGKELDAVLSYLDKLKPQCETKVMTYAERVAKREAEIAGLKEALEILA